MQHGERVSTPTSIQMGVEKEKAVIHIGVSVPRSGNELRELWMAPSSSSLKRDWRKHQGNEEPNSL